MSDFRTRLERELVAAAGRPQRLRYARSPLPTWPERPTATALAALVLLIVVAVAGSAALRPLASTDRIDERRQAAPGVDGFRPIVARVVSRSGSAWYQRLAIDRGRDDGIYGGEAVVDARGLVGRVTEVTGGSAIVTLLTDPSSVAAAITRSSAQTGAVVADLRAPGELLLTAVEDPARVRDGELVATDGTPNALRPQLPATLPIGRVERIGGGRIRVAPAADLQRVETVRVLIAAQTYRVAPNGGPVTRRRTGSGHAQLLRLSCAAEQRAACLARRAHPDDRTALTSG